MQRMQENRLDRFAALVVAVIFAAALCMAHMDLVGSLVAGAGKAMGIHKGFVQNDWMRIKFLPVPGKQADVGRKKS